MDSRFDTVDRRFEAIDRRFEAIDRGFETMELRADNPCDLSGIHVSHSYLYIYTWLSDHDSLVVPLFLNGNPRDHPSRPRTGLSQIS